MTHEAAEAGVVRWAYLLHVNDYDRTPELTDEELLALEPLSVSHGWGGRTVITILESAAGAERLARPLRDALARLEGNEYWKVRALVALLRGCLWEGTALWAWSNQRGRGC